MAWVHYTTIDLGLNLNFAILLDFSTLIRSFAGLFDASRHLGASILFVHAVYFTEATKAQCCRLDAPRTIESPFGGEVSQPWQSTSCDSLQHSSSDCFVASAISKTRNSTKGHLPIADKAHHRRRRLLQPRLRASLAWKQFSGRRLERATRRLARKASSATRRTGGCH